MTPDDRILQAHLRVELAKLNAVHHKSVEWLQVTFYLIKQVGLSGAGRHHLLSCKVIHLSLRESLGDTLVQKRACQVSGEV